MAGYIGSQTPVVSNGSQRKYTFTATAAQTVFTGMDIPNPQQIQVFQNGVRLVITTDYTVSSGTTVTLVNAASAGDSLVVILFADYQFLDQDLSGDFSVDSPTFYVDSTNNRVGVGTASPSNPFQVGTSDLIVDSSGNVGIGTSSLTGKTHIYKSSVNSAIIGTSYNGHYFESQSDDATDGFEVYQKHGSNTTRNSFIVNDNRTGSKSAAFVVRGDGNVGIGTGSPSYPLVISTGASSAQLQLARSTDGTQRSIAIFRSSSQGADVGSISVNNSATAFNTSSDYRLKENVTDVTDGITRVKQLEPKRFNFISDPDKTVDGFLAHEAQAVVPEAVTGTHNEVDDDGNAVMQGIDQSKLVPLLTAALKEAITKIETLETEMTSVKARLDALEGN